MSILRRSKCTPPYRFDTHHHILPPEYVSALRNLGIRGAAVVLVHPTDPAWGSIEGLDFPNALLESPFETTRAVANLLYNGVLTRFPNIRVIVSHAGGTIPFLAWKLGLAHQSRATGVPVSKWPMTWRSGNRIPMKASRS